MVTKLEQLKEWAKQNVTLIDLLPNNNNLQVTTRLIDVLEDEVDEKYYLSEEKTKKLTLDNDLGGKLNMYDYNERDKIHSVNKVSPTLNTMQGGDRQPKVAVLGNTSNTGHRSQNIHDISGISPTIAARDYKGAKQVAVREATKQGYAVAEQGVRIRKLVPIETWRLQSFTDEQFYKAKESGVSNSQLYKQSGNAITISVADAIIKKITEG